MTTHLYCLLPKEVRATVPPGLSGLAGAAVRELPVDGLVAWVSDVERGITVSYDGVRAHDAVVEAALETGTTPVPARFGQRFVSDDACRAAIASKAESVGSVLADLQGFVEMTLIVTPSTRRMLRELQPVIPEIFEPETRGPGRKYLDSLRRREAATGAVQEAIDELAVDLSESTRNWVRRTVVHDTVTPLPLRTISHLIARRDIGQYKEAVVGVPHGREFRYLLIGPRAPYSFSGGNHGMKLAD